MNTVGKEALKIQAKIEAEVSNHEEKIGYNAMVSMEIKYNALLESIANKVKLAFMKKARDNMKLAQKKMLEAYVESRNAEIQQAKVAAYLMLLEEYFGIY